MNTENTEIELASDGDIEAQNETITQINVAPDFEAIRIIREEVAANISCWDSLSEPST